MEEKIDNLEEMLSDISDKLDNIIDTVESAAETGAESGASSAIEDLEASIPQGQSPLITVISQDKKLILSAFSFEARRCKKGEDPYLIRANTSPVGYQYVVGKYDNKEAALNEMKNIAKAVSVALQGGPKFYEIK